MIQTTLPEKDGKKKNKKKTRHKDDNNALNCGSNNIARKIKEKSTQRRPTPKTLVSSSAEHRVSK